MNLVIYITSVCVFWTIVNVESLFDNIVTGIEIAVKFQIDYHMLLARKLVVVV